MKKVVIIGAGMGGLTFAIKLQQQSFDNFEYIIFEKGSEVGGTWRDNTYPGAASDVGIHFYSLSSDLKPDWTRTHCGQSEILEYWKVLAKRYKLYSHITFDTRVTGADWDDKTQRYHVETENLLTGKRIVTTADILISAVGVLEQPHYPDIGLSNFKGSMWHSARWRHDITLSGKRVGVIGNGASASQFVPIVSQNPSVQLTQFVRTANWFLPLGASSFSASWKWAFTNIPLLTSLYRLKDFFTGDYLYMIFASGLFRSIAQKKSREYILRTAPSEYHDALIPNFPLGCKRIVLDVNYLNCLHRPNVTISTDGISEVLPDGILTKKGDKVPLDVLILATGFNSHDYPIKVRGRLGQTIQEYYDSSVSGAPRAYLGTTLPTFPNFYMLSGPNTATGHTSVLYSEELQTEYCLKLVLPVLRGQVSSFEVREVPTDSFNDWLQKRISDSVFMKCHSWYRKGGDGTVSSIFPGSQFQHWWILRNPVWSHYKAVNGEAWVRECRARTIGTVAWASSLIVVTWQDRESVGFVAEVIHTGILKEIADAIAYG